MLLRCHACMHAQPRLIHAQHSLHQVQVNLIDNGSPHCAVPPHGSDLGCSVCMQYQVQEAELALQLYAPMADRDRIRIAVSEASSIDWADT